MSSIPTRTESRNIQVAANSNAFRQPRIHSAIPIQQYQLTTSLGAVAARALKNDNSWRTDYLSGFGPLKVSSSVAVEGMKTKHATHLTRNEKRLNQIRASTASIRSKQFDKIDNKRPQTAPNHATHESTYVEHKRQEAIEPQNHPDSLPGHIPVPVLSAATMQKIRINEAEKTRSRTSSASEDSLNLIAITKNEVKEEAVVKPWKKVKEKIAMKALRQDDIANQHLTNLTDLDCSENVIRNSLEVLLDLSKNNGINKII